MVKEWIKNPWLRGGLLALILVVFAAGLLILAFRVWEPPDLAKLLPAGETLHYQEGNLVSGSPPGGTAELRGIADIQTGFDPATQSIIASPLEFYSIGQRNQLLLDETHRLFKRYYVVAQNPTLFEILDDVRSGEILSLSRDTFFQAMRPALPYRAPFFEFYRTSIWLEKFGLPNFPFGQNLGVDLENLATGAFPLFASAQEETEVGTLTKTYVVSDKEFKMGEADYPYLFHLDKKYKGKLLSYLPEGVATIYAGEQLSATVKQLIDLLKYADVASTEEGLETKIDRFFATYFGPTQDREQTQGPILDNEYAFAFFVPSAPALPESPAPLAPFLLALELTPDTTPLLDRLVQAFLAQGLVQIDREQSSIKAEKLTPERIEYKGYLYDLYVLPSGQPFLAALIKADVAILTTGKNEMEQVIEAMRGIGRYTESEKYRMIEPLIDRVDHLRVQDAIVDGQPSAGSQSIRAVGVNLFDDGMMIFTHEAP